MTNYWWFCNEDMRLRYGDGRTVSVGITHDVAGQPVAGKWGLHACPKALHAVHYATGPIACRVDLGGVIVADTTGLLLSASERKYVAIFDSRDVLLAWAQHWFDIILLMNNVGRVAHLMSGVEDDLGKAIRNRHTNWQKFIDAVSGVVWGVCQLVGKVYGREQYMKISRKAFADLEQRFIQEVRNHE